MSTKNLVKDLVAPMEKAKELQALIAKLDELTFEVNAYKRFKDFYDRFVILPLRDLEKQLKRGPDFQHSMFYYQAGVVNLGKIIKTELHDVIDKYLLSGELDFSSACTRGFARIFRNNCLKNSIPVLPLSKNTFDIYKLEHFNTDLTRDAHCAEDLLCTDIDKFQIYVPNKANCFNCKGVQELDLGKIKFLIACFVVCGKGVTCMMKNLNSPNVCNT